MVATRTLRDEDIASERRAPRSPAARHALERAVRRETRRTERLELPAPEPHELESEPALAAE